MNDNVLIFPAPLVAITCRVITPEGLGASLMLEMRRADVPPETVPGQRLTIKKNNVDFTVEIVAITPWEGTV